MGGSNLQETDLPTGGPRCERHPDGFKVKEKHKVSGKVEDLLGTDIALNNYKKRAWLDLVTESLILAGQG